VNEQEIVRIAVRTTMTAMGWILATVLVLFLTAAAISPDINIPGIDLNNSTLLDRPAGD
jgi:hypothetical protein